MGEFKIQGIMSGKMNIEKQLMKLYHWPTTNGMYVIF